MTVSYPIALACTFLWLGFVSAISFMEAWLKFRAPGITLSLGLGIGKLVFRALNIVEWVLALAIAVNIFNSDKNFAWLDFMLYYGAVIILILETFWLLPKLNKRATLILKNKTVPPSSTHIYFIGMEIIKTVLLLFFGIALFNSI